MNSLSSVGDLEQKTIPWMRLLVRIFSLGGLERDPLSSAGDGLCLVLPPERLAWTVSICEREESWWLWFGSFSALHSSLCFRDVFFDGSIEVFGESYCTLDEQWWRTRIYAIRIEGWTRYQLRSWSIYPLNIRRERPYLFHINLEFDVSGRWQQQIYINSLSRTWMPACRLIDRRMCTTVPSFRAGEDMDESFEKAKEWRWTSSTKDLLPSLKIWDMKLNQLASGSFNMENFSWRQFNNISHGLSNPNSSVPFMIYFWEYVGKDEYSSNLHLHPPEVIFRGMEENWEESSCSYWRSNWGQLRTLSIPQERRLQVISYQKDIKSDGISSVV